MPSPTNNRETGAESNPSPTTTERYCVALKRQYWDSPPVDWLQTVKDTSGVTIVGDSEPGIRRILVAATASAAILLQERLGTFCHIEGEIPHYPINS